MKVKSGVLKILQTCKSSYVPTEFFLQMFGRSYTAAISRLKKEWHKIVILKYTNNKKYTRWYYLEKTYPIKKENNILYFIALRIIASLFLCIFYYLILLYVR